MKSHHLKLSLTFCPLSPHFSTPLISTRNTTRTPGYCTFTTKQTALRHGCGVPVRLSGVCGTGCWHVRTVHITKQLSILFYVGLFSFVWFESYRSHQVGLFVYLPFFQWFPFLISACFSISLSHYYLLFSPRSISFFLRLYLIISQSNLYQFLSHFLPSLSLSIFLSMSLSLEGLTVFTPRALLASESLSFLPVPWD
jgi:hypothetical protein